MEARYEGAYEEYGSVVRRAEGNAGCAPTLSAALSDHAKRTSGDFASQFSLGQITKL